ncbi:DNA methyltransferase [bacterium]|nr:DNA methyltransferase [bacterium]
MSLKANQIHQGSCLDRLKEIDQGSIDLVFADPPFNIGYQYDAYDDQKSSDEYLQFCESWITESHRVLQPDGSFWLAIGDEYAAELKLLSQKIGFHCRSWVIWYYTFGVNCARGFSRSHTHLFHFVKNKERFTFNGENPAVRVASARQLVYADARANSKGRLPDNTWILRPQDVPSPGFSMSHDTWCYSRVAGTFKEREGFHGCQMPEQLLGRIIRVSSHSGDVVLDPFAGSGTTLAVAKKLGRQFLGVELSTDYVSKIRTRLDDCEAGDALDGADGPSSGVPTSKGKRRNKFVNGRPVISLPDEAEQSIIDAFMESADGHSADYLLCDPGLNSNFVKSCRKRSVPGDPRLWNSFLLRVRKSGKLPRSVATGQRLSTQEMDPYSDASEVASRLMTLDYGMTLDELLCSPEAIQEFDQMAQSFSSGHSSFEYRWSALALRKRATTKRFRTIATEQKQHWATQKLPRRRSLESCLAKQYEHSGVYALFDENFPVYVGETSNLRERIENVLGSEGWKKFNPNSVRIWQIREEVEQFALRSYLVTKDKPLLNSDLLVAE